MSPPSSTLDICALWSVPAPTHRTVQTPGDAE